MLLYTICILFLYIINLLILKIMSLANVTVRQRQTGSLGAKENLSSVTHVVDTSRIFASPSVCTTGTGIDDPNVNSKIILDGNPVITLWVTETVSAIRDLQEFA
jgi:hypothetical protein